MGLGVGDGEYVYVKGFVSLGQGRSKGTRGQGQCWKEVGWWTAGRRRAGWEHRAPATHGGLLRLALGSLL